MWHIVTLNVELAWCFCDPIFCMFSGFLILSPNVALNGTATQISTFDHYGLLSAQFAIDGDFSTNLDDRIDRCAHTNQHYGAWWQVDLHVSYQIEKVAITTRRGSSMFLCILFIFNYQL